jgi:ketosteroid isomerase-like protein
MSRENVELVRQGWDAWFRGDLEGMFSNLDPDVVWDTSHFRDWPESSYYGIEGLRRFLTEWLEVWDEYEVGIEEILVAPDGRVVTLHWHRGKGRDSGAPMYMEMAQVATVRDGKVTRIENWDDRDEALRLVGLRE